MGYTRSSRLDECLSSCIEAYWPGTGLDTARFSCLLWNALRKDQCIKALEEFLEEKGCSVERAREGEELERGDYSFCLPLHQGTIICASGCDRVYEAYLPRKAVLDEKRAGILVANILENEFAGKIFAENLPLDGRKLRRLVRKYFTREGLRLKIVEIEYSGSTNRACCSLVSLEDTTLLEEVAKKMRIPREEAVKLVLGRVSEILPGLGVEPEWIDYYLRHYKAVLDRASEGDVERLAWKSGSNLFIDLVRLVSRHATGKDTEKTMPEAQALLVALYLGGLISPQKECPRRAGDSIEVEKYKASGINPNLNDHVVAEFIAQTLHSLVLGEPDSRLEVVLARGLARALGLRHIEELLEMNKCPRIPYWYGGNLHQDMRKYNETLGSIEGRTGNNLVSRKCNEIRENPASPERAVRDLLDRARRAVSNPSYRNYRELVKRLYRCQTGTCVLYLLRELEELATSGRAEEAPFARILSRRIVDVLLSGVTSTGCIRVNITGLVAPVA